MFLIGDNLPEGFFKLHSSFSKVLNYYNSEDLLSFVLPEVGVSSVSVVLDVFPENIPEEAVVNSKQIILGNIVINKDDCKIYNSNPEIFYLPKNIDDFINISFNEISKSGLLFLIDKNQKQEGAIFQNFAKRMTDGVLSFFYDPVSGAKKIKGLGFGLTPTGDDFLCGAISALWLKNRFEKLGIEELIDDIYRASLSDNLLSNSFLKQAKKGSFFYQFKEVVENIAKNDKKKFKISAKKLSAVGETSGSAMLCGLLLTLKSFNLPKAK